MTLTITSSTIGPLAMGIASFYRNQQWTFAKIYDIPFGKGRKFGSSGKPGGGYSSGRLGT